jgi:hypothetical protein
MQVSIFVAFLPILFLILLFALVYFIPKWLQRQKDNREELINTAATVLSKRYHAPSKYIVSYTYHITFELADHRQVELRIPAKRYGSIVEGDHGILQYQGSRFIKWVKTV